MIRPFLLCLSTAGVLSGCSAYRDMKYPSDWPQLRTIATDSDCRHLNGEYRNEADTGVAADTFNGSHLPRFVHIPLADVFRPPLRENPDAAIGSVVLVVDAGIKVWTREHDGSALSPLAVEGDWQCAQGFLHRSTRDNEASEQDLIRRNTQVLTLGLSDEGALVVERSDRSTGVAFLAIPYTMGGNAWSRYRRISTSPTP